jgi:NADPH-dependent 2,4-dienoyl-CoA reductase/sulfur reductase-like enzyme/rhodanese-related sulfurtransferase
VDSKGNRIQMKNKKLLIVGGVAGGASCAARARRLSENAEIIIFERGPYVSFANCGLPYYVGNVIAREEDLLVTSPQLFRERFNIDVRTEHNVRSISPGDQTVEVEELKTGRLFRESYDALVLSPGSAPIKPNLHGLDLPGIFTLWTIPDTRRIVEWIQDKNVRHATVVGGGFIGLEMTENLKRRGIDVTIIEMQRHVMPALDPEMAEFIHDHLLSHHVDLQLGSPVTRFEQASKQKIRVVIQSGKIITTDMVLLSVGVRPRIELAEAAGLFIGELGGIKVDDQMRTSDRNIWAVGDAVQVTDVVTNIPTMVPLAGPANRQGRIAADVIMGNDLQQHKFRGVQATAVCGILGLTVASTGVTEKFLNRYDPAGKNNPFEKIYLHPDHHAAYYPDAKTITIKLIFSKTDGKILGAQALGLEGVEKRIDVISMAIQKNGTIFDLEEAELCYAPQYGSAKDPVNMAGMIAANILRGYVSVGHWEDLAESDAFILDVRDPDEYEEACVRNAANIPLNSLRQRINELPRNREIWAHCYVGQRSYYASRILAQKNFKVRNISGGFLMYDAVRKTMDL